MRLYMLEKFIVGVMMIHQILLLIKFVKLKQGKNPLCLRGDYLPFCIRRATSLENDRSGVYQTYKLQIRWRSPTETLGDDGFFDVRLTPDL